MKILILTEAGQNIGRGHLSRSLGLQDGFSNIDVFSFIDGDFDIPEGVAIYDWHNKSLEDFKSQYKTVIIDSYLISETKEREIRDLFEKVVIIDDYNRKTYLADLIINPNIYGDSIDYTNQTAKILGGKKYIILRDELIENKKSKIIGFPKNLLITVGGSDTKNLFPKLIETFQDDFVKVIVLAGKKAKELSKKFPQTSLAIHENVDSKKLAELYGIADIAITAGGVTMSELAFCGTPFVAIQTGIDQEKNILAYQKEGLINRVIKAEDENLVKILKQEIEILKDEQKRAELSFKGQCLISPKGAGNIIEAVASLKSCL